MICVIHYTNKDPEVHYDMTPGKEKNLLMELRKTHLVNRAYEWFGQTNPSYAVHHWNAHKK